MSRRRVGIAVLLALWATTESDAQSTPRTIELIEDLRIISDDGPAAFRHIAALEVDGAGRIYVLDVSSSQVRVFDRAGKHVRTLGRNGSGPGELRQPLGLALDGGGRLWIPDAGNGRWVIYDTGGSAPRQLPRNNPTVVQPWPGRIDNRGRLIDVARSGENERRLVRFDATLTRGDTFSIPLVPGPRIQVPGGGAMYSIPVPFTPQTSWALTPEGTVWVGTSSMYAVLHRTLAGDSLGEIRSSRSAAPVTANDRNWAKEMFKDYPPPVARALEASQMPIRKPAFEALLVDDDSRVWVALPSERGDIFTTFQRFDVFAPNGAQMAEVTSRVPLLASVPLIIRGGFVYGVVVNPDHVMSVVRLRLTQPLRR